MSGDLTEAMTSTRAVLEAAVPQKAGADLCELASSLCDQRDILVNALEDSRSALAYIKAVYGMLAGVGWERVETAMAAALRAAGRLPCK